MAEYLIPAVMPVGIVHTLKIIYIAECHTEIPGPFILHERFHHRQKPSSVKQVRQCILMRVIRELHIFLLKIVSFRLACIDIYRVVKDDRKYRYER